jgi:predicted nucleotide-binding protein
MSATKNSSQQALVVAGLDSEMTANVVGTITKLGFTPVVFDTHDANAPKDLIEGFDNYKDAALGVVMLADDEVGTLRSEFPRNVKLRARPQVVFQAGFLLGKLGASKVIFLYLPSFPAFPTMKKADGILIS